MACSRHPAYLVFNATQPVEDYGSVSTLHVKETLCGTIYGGSTYEQGACQSPCSATSALWKLNVSAQILHGAVAELTPGRSSLPATGCFAVHDPLQGLGGSRRRDWKQGCVQRRQGHHATSAIMPCHASNAVERLTLECSLTLSSSGGFSGVMNSISIAASSV